MPKKKKFYKKPRYIIFFMILIIGSFLAYWRLTIEEPPVYDFVLAEKGELLQEVSVTGRVKAAESADLAFEVNGKVAELLVDVGDKVVATQRLASLNNADASAQLKQAQAGVWSAQASLQQYQAIVDTRQAQLNEIKSGNRPEEIQIAKTGVTNAENLLEDAEDNLTSIKAKTVVDLQEDYNNILNALPTVVNTAKTALLNLTDIQYIYFSGSDQESTRIASAKKVAVDSLLGTKNAGRWTTSSLSILNDGAFGLAQDIMMETDYMKIDEAINVVLAALNDVKVALDATPIKQALSVTDKTLLENEKANISREITDISAKKQLISVQKVNNVNLITTAESEVSIARNAVATAQGEWRLSRAGSTDAQIAAQEAQVREAQANVTAQRAQIQQAQANVQQYQAQLEKTILYAPIDGIITRKSVKVGEIIALNTPVIGLISEDNFEIEANVPEVDIAKIKIEDLSDVTLDAYGGDIFFNAKVIKIDPAETMVEGISTYKVTLQFLKSDGRIKSGMTANLDILTAQRDQAIIVPQRAIITKDGEKMVRLLTTQTSEKDPTKASEVIVEMDVVTGLRGSDGRIEVVEGVEEGDKVIIFIKDSK